MAGLVAIKVSFCVDHPEALQEKLCRLTKKLPPTKLCEKVLSVGVFLSLAIFLSGAWLGSTSLGLFFKVTGDYLCFFSYSIMHTGSWEQRRMTK